MNERAYILAGRADQRQHTLRSAGWHNAKFPSSELLGHKPCLKARRAFLVGIPVTFTKSDRSMVFQRRAPDDAGTPGWSWLVLFGNSRLTDKQGRARMFSSRAGALAAARKAEGAV